MKRTFFITAIVLFLVSIGLVGFKCNNPETNASKPGNDEPAVRNYQTYCAGCHGENLEKFAAKKWMDEKDREPFGFQSETWFKFFVSFPTDGSITEIF